VSDFSERHEVEGVAMHTPEFERQIAETMAERERGNPRRYSVLRGPEGWWGVFEAKRGFVGKFYYTRREAVAYLEGLLDAAEARDREATK